MARAATVFAVSLVACAVAFAPPKLTRNAIYIPSRSSVASVGLHVQTTNASPPPASSDLEPREERGSQINPSAEFGTPISDDFSNFNRAAVGFVKNSVFDAVFPPTSISRAYARFYALETIARMPYFAYLSVLHMYETVGRWRRAEYLKTHFAESWNELHHLLIMEELGGDERWLDRFVAQHVAVSYYWFVVVVYIINPTIAYNLNQAVEEHAFETYDEFVKENGEMLAALPAPEVAKRYYRDGDMYMFDSMHVAGDMLCGVESMTCDEVTGRDAPTGGVRRPKCDTLLDTFMNIRDDEAEHVRTMEYMQRQDSNLIDGKFSR